MPDLEPIIPIIPTIADELADIVRVGLVRAAPVAVGEAGAELKRKISSLCNALRSTHAGQAPSKIPGLQSARDLYRAFGIDPTRIRPSSEALLRRVMRGQDFPHINSAVDVCNLIGLRSLLPPGLYDADAIDGPVVLRRGEAGESFEGIRKADVHLAGRPTLADTVGAFGNPTSDSLRTSVSESTQSLWFVLFAPASFSREQLEIEIERAQDDMARYLAPVGVAVETHATVIP
ncbi:MAG: phenylalanine--tRNA ligase beta subunit-related protein [Myxococcota bacterium]